MAKVEIIGPKSLFLDVVAALHEEGRIHIEDLSKKIKNGEIALDPMSMQDDDLKRYDQLEELLESVRAVLSMLPTPANEVDRRTQAAEYERLWALAPDELAVAVRQLVAAADAEVATVAKQRAAAEAELGMLARYEPVLGKIQPLARQFVVTGQFDSVALLIERRYKEGLEKLKEELVRLTRSQCEVVSQDIDEETTAAIVVYARPYAEAVHRFLAMENVNQIRLPQDFHDQPLDVAYQALRLRRAGLPGTIDSLRATLSVLAEKWVADLTTAREVLEDRVDEIVTIPQFGRTDYAFMIDGWVPAADVDALSADMKERFGKDIMFSQVEITEKEFEEAPVALINPEWARPYEELLGFMGTPRYGTYDPTWLLAIFYPLFFGMIVGDIGYGSIMLGTVIWLKMRYREHHGVQTATSILGPAATSAVFFGFVYGELFGDLLGRNFTNLIHPLYLSHGALTFAEVPGAVQLLPFERTGAEMLVPFLLIAVGVGFVQVLLGLVLGIYNGARTKHWSHVYEKGGMLAFILGFAALILGVAFAKALIGMAPWVQAVGAAAVVGGFGFAIKGGKLLGAIESVSAIANIASYLRIMAVGLAGAIFAEAVNSIAAKMGNPILGIAVAVPLQALNFVIAAFSPNIHAVRLNFLEFFGKFYETGEKTYKPFHKTGGENRT